MGCHIMERGCHGRDRVVIWFTAYAINCYYHYHCEFEPRSWWGVLDITLCDKVCQWLATCQWFSPSTPVSSTIKMTTTIYSETCLNQTLSKLKTCLNQTDFTVLSNKYLCTLNLSKLNKFFSSKGVRFRQVLLYNQTCLMRPSKGTVKYGHIKQVVAKYSFTYNAMHCEGKYKLRSHNTSYCWIEVVTKGGLTVT